MINRRSVVGLASFGIVLVSACGGGAPVAPPPATPAPAAEPAASAKPEADPKPAPDAKTLAKHKREFMTGCATKAINSPDYCECAWDEFRKVFTDDEMSSTAALPKEKLEKVKASVETTCASKIPEELVKKGFDQGCMGDRKELQPYCDCTWSEFRKRFSAAELRDEDTVKGDRFLASRAPVIKACATKLTEAVAKDSFTKECAKDPKNDKFCACAWKELRKVGSAAEVYAGLIDEGKARAALEKTCVKLRGK
ncbi:MAG: hypothetical protein JST00_09745 [Deltaproteobacteria bacterium]|nr:hypothetical protein [Deltaproteobacteria bacterium]